MNLFSASTNDCLNRLLVIHLRSLAMYLRDAQPFMGNDPRAPRAGEVLAAMATENERIVDELGELLLDRNWPLYYGEYPLKYTAYHDLALDFLIDRLIDEQRRNIQGIEQCVRQLEGESTGRALAEQSLGVAKAHLEQLLTLKTPLSVTAS